MQGIFENRTIKTSGSRKHFSVFGRKTFVLHFSPRISAIFFIFLYFYCSDLQICHVLNTFSIVVTEERFINGLPRNISINTNVRIDANMQSKVNFCLVA